MRVLVTGASGFLGQAVVRAGVARGHDLVAMVRPAANVADLNWAAGQVRVVRGDLRQTGPWIDEISSIEAVVHLAAAPVGDLHTQFVGTVVTTEMLLQHLNLSTIERFVHVSSLSVYDFNSLIKGGMLDEDTPLEASPEERDPYTETKIVQEQLVRSACSAAGTPYVILRPGAIFGAGKDWGLGAAVSAFGIDFIVSPQAKFRLTYVDNCASAIISAVEAPMAVNGTFNIVDDDLPTHSEFYRLCRDAGAIGGRQVPVPWLILTSCGNVLAWFNRHALAGRARLPELLSRKRQQARWKPLVYSNDRAKAALEWSPRISVRDGVKAMLVGAQQKP